MAGDTDVLLDNAGTIAAGGSARRNVLFGTGDNRLVIRNGSNISGVVNGSGGTDTLDYSFWSGSGVNANLGAGTGTGFTNITGFENIVGSAQGDVLTGSAGANRIDGGAGNDTLNGGLGNDTLVGGAGNDTLNGGGDVDTADYSTSSANVTANLATGTATDGLGGTDTLIGVENLVGGAGNDRLTGDGNGNVLNGGNGNDTLVGGIGSDTLIGGAGTDTADYSANTAAQGIIANLTAGTVVDGLGGGTDTLATIESVTGGAGNDVLNGDGNANVLTGGDGNDTLAGRAGQDTLIGGGGNDRITWRPGDGNDTVTLGAGSDVLDLGTTFGGITSNTDAWTVALPAGGTPGTATFANTSTNETVTVTDWTGGQNEVICFYPGTLIATPGGERAVEALVAGDLVLTADGAALPIRWMGRQTVSTRFADPLRVLPIRIAAGALAEGLPQRDLLVSPGHALLLGGVLVNAGALVNGTTIRRESRVPEVFTYRHIELATHDLVLAEGVAAETFVDNAERRHFDNWAEHPQADMPPTIEEMVLPRAMSQRQVPPALYARLMARAAEGACAAA